MHNWLVGICDRLQNIRLVVWLVTAQYAYPFIQWTHFTGLSLWVGTTLALDFRLLGVGKRFQTAAELSDALFLWNWLGLGIAVLGDVILRFSPRQRWDTSTILRFASSSDWCCRWLWRGTSSCNESRALGDERRKPPGGQARRPDGNRAVGIGGRGGGVDS